MTPPGPIMHDGIFSLMVNMTLLLLSNNIVNFRTSLIRTEIKTMGVFQPLVEDKIEQNPEGQRDWATHSLHSLPNLFAKVNDRVVFDDITYKVMSRKDWRINGYMYYELIEDYIPEEDETSEAA